MKKRARKANNAMVWRYEEGDWRTGCWPRPRHGGGGVGTRGGGAALGGRLHRSAARQLGLLDQMHGLASGLLRAPRHAARRRAQAHAARRRRWADGCGEWPRPLAPRLV